MENGVAYVCVPAGTRNHLALDLGLDRDDVVGALDAFDSGIEHPIDLAFVNGRIFVNNVSLGVPTSAIGLSPAAVRPSLSGSTLRELWRIATARR